MLREHSDLASRACVICASLVGQMVKSPPANAGDSVDMDTFNPSVRKIPWRRKCQPTPVFLPGKSHG